MAGSSRSVESGLRGLDPWALSIGLVVTFGCVLGGYMAMGGYMDVLMQPWELVIIGGAALGIYLIAKFVLGR